MATEKYCLPEQDSCRCELSVIITVSTRPVQTEARLTSNLERESQHEVPPLTEEIQATDNAREESDF